MYDIAAVIDQGKRERQEDALAFGLHDDRSPGFIVLADGMGGHAAGSTASGIAVASVHDELADALDAGLPEDDKIANLLHSATLRANTSIAQYVAFNQEAEGMGTTIVVPLLTKDKLHWASVGDSPLYHYRNGSLTRLNEDHSMAPAFDLLAEVGLMDEEVALFHPDRNWLTSALVGEDIPKIDVSSLPVQLQPDDVILACSDGLLFISDEEILNILDAHKSEDSTAISDALLAEIKELDHPAQDNVSIVVVKVLKPD